MKSLLLVASALLLAGSACASVDGNPDQRSSLDFRVGYSELGSKLESALATIDYGTYTVWTPSVGMKIPVARSLTVLWSFGYRTVKNRDLSMVLYDEWNAYELPATLRESGANASVGLRIYLGR